MKPVISAAEATCEGVASLGVARPPARKRSKQASRRVRERLANSEQKSGSAHRHAGESPSPLRLYLREVGSHRVLTRREETALAKAIELHLDALKKALLGIPFTARFLVEKWQALRGAKLSTGALDARSPAQRDPDAAARIDRAMTQVEALLSRRVALSERQGEGSRSCARIDSQIQRVLLTLDLSPDILGQALNALRDRAGALSPAGNASPGCHGRARLLREIGLSAAVFGKRMHHIEHHTEALAQARNRFVEHNLKLVVKIAKEFSGMGLPLIDLIQEGNLVLLHAVEKFDHRRGVKFSTYGSWWIRQACIRAIQRQARTIRLPSNVYDRMLRMDRLDGELASRLGHAPKAGELSAALRVSEPQLETLRLVRHNTIPLETPIPGLEERTVEDTVADSQQTNPAEAIDHGRIVRQIPELLPILPTRERRVLSWRFGLGSDRQHTLAEIGRRLKLSRERVRQIESAAIAKLRSELEERRLLETAD